MSSDGTSEQAFSQTLTLTSTSKRNRLEQFVAEFADSCSRMTSEQAHTHLDETEQVHGLYLYRAIYNLGMILNLSRGQNMTSTKLPWVFGILPCNLD